MLQIYYREEWHFLKKCIFDRFIFLNIDGSIIYAPQTNNTLMMEPWKTVIFACLLSAGTAALQAQIFNQPNYALKSHETLQINRIVVSAEKTTISFSVENKIIGGNFCADKNIYIITPDGVKHKLSKALGIPVCPESYIFKTIGEVLQFTLEFPPINTETKWIDIIEDCNSNCFRFYGVTLDNELNKRLDEVFSLPSSVKPAESIILFTKILDEIDNQNLGIEGLLYINIITASIDDNDKPGAMMWYKRLGESHAPRANEYLKFLNDKGIKY